MPGFDRPHSSPTLRGRSHECATLVGLIDKPRAGGSAVLVVNGEAGIGKTALLDFLADAAGDLTVARAGGVESEMELTFAALHQLCGPMLGNIERLPRPQHDALATAFGLRAGPAPDRFLIGLAVLNLLSEAADERPCSRSGSPARTATRWPWRGWFGPHRRRRRRSGHRTCCSTAWRQTTARGTRPACRCFAGP